MNIYPSIYIKNGRCVRLMRGDINKAEDFGDPVEKAVFWEKEGAEYIHVVDVDAAVSGEFKNKDVVAEMVHQLKIPVQMGGGIRNEKDIEERLDKIGISRVIMGTAVHENPELVKWATGMYGDRIGVAIDANEGKVCIEGWVKKVEENPVDLAKRMRDNGVKNIVFTDVSRDGMMTGPNIEIVEAMVKSTWINIVASGGIRTLEDIAAIKGTGASGAILGKSLYLSAFSLEQAKQVAK